MLSSQEMFEINDNRIVLHFVEFHLLLSEKEVLS